MREPDRGRERENASQGDPKTTFPAGVGQSAAILRQVRRGQIRQRFRRFRVPAMPQDSRHRDRRPGNR
jgi:hypothetical protein